MPLGMAFQMSNSFLLVSLVAVLFFFSLEKSFAFQTAWEDTIERHHVNLHQHSHDLVHLSSLLPSPSCSSSTKGQLNLPSLPPLPPKTMDFFL